MKCADCQRELEPGDRYIKDTPSGYIDTEADPMIDGLISEIMGGSGGELIYCEDCTEPGGKYLFDTVYGDEGTAHA